MAPVEEYVGMDSDRSNKGASKQRRDQINAEINILRDLLPLQESSRQRLSQLQVMSLSCVYIRKCNIIQKLFRSFPQESQLPDCVDFFQAMTGFLLVITREGKLIYISENVTDYLGHSMVDMKTQGDSLYDIVDKRDHPTVQGKLMQAGAAFDSKDDSLEDVSFFCRMNMSRTLKRQSGFGDVKVMHIQGHFVATNDALYDSNISNVTNDQHHHHHHLHQQQQQQQIVFLATCSPLITPDLKENLVVNNTNVFKTVHQLDMSFMEITQMAEYHLEQSSEDLYKTSWYSLIHPEDIHEAKEKHTQLVRSNHHEIGCMMTVRMLKADGSFFWVNIVMHIKQTLLSQTDEPYIVCINQIVSAQEAYQIRVQNQMFSLYPGRVQELWGNHMQNVSSTPNYPISQWVQQEGNGAVSLPGFQFTMPNYTNQSRFQSMYPNGRSGISMSESDRTRMTNGGKAGSIGVSQYELTNLASPADNQTDKLKAMLKRKIQGPTVSTQCSRSAKVPKMMWEQFNGACEGEIYHDNTAVVAEQFTNGRKTQVVQYPGGQVLQVMTATAPSPPIGIHAMTKKSYPTVPETIINDFTCISPQHQVKVEQVVPDINVPDSYLTPDPSPISSPEPAIEKIKTEVVDPDELGSKGTSSVSILQALEKLASQPQDALLIKSSSSLSYDERKPTRVKTGRKELPIFDAFEIENFFDQLDVPANDAKVSHKVENILFEQSFNKKSSVHPPMCNGFQLSTNIKTENNVEMSPRSLIKTERADVQYYQPSNRKDCVVSSTMIHSPKSVSSQETLNRCASLDDFVNCFSDSCSNDSSQFQLENRQSDFRSSFVKGGSLGNSFDFQKLSQTDSVCEMSVLLGDHRGMEELSPQSTSSCSSRDDDLMDRSGSWSFGMELESLDTSPQMQSPLHHGGFKSQDSFGVFDQIEGFLDSIVPS